MPKPSGLQAEQSLGTTGSQAPGNVAARRYPMGGKSLYSVFSCLRCEWETWTWLFPKVEKRSETFCPGAGAMDVCGTSSRLCRLDLRI